MRATLLSIAALAAAAFAFSAVPAAQAWDATGHMVAACIAYDHLKPRTKAAVDSLLRQHKDYAKWVAHLPKRNSNSARYIFECAATWPDDVRGTADDHPTWHYVGMPVTAPGYPVSSAATMIPIPNVQTQIPAEFALMKDEGASTPDRAIALCWVAHLVADIHQPLHAASYFSPLVSNGDRGGNSILLSASQFASDPTEAAANPSNLHALWDDTLGATRDPAQIDRIAARLETSEFSRAKLSQLKRDKTVASWAKESNTLAQTFAYDNGRLALRADGLAVHAALPAGYLAKMRRTADRQIALAGLRLADLLNSATFPPVTVSPIPQAASLGSAALANHGPIIGNRRSHVYHLPGDTHPLPSERNRVYFQTEQAAQAAGYRALGR